MKIASWNINGIKARQENVLAWLRDADPDIALFQEIKSVDENFPASPFEDMGYNVATHGQKGFNGVAILSKKPLEDVRRGLPGDDSDEQARYIEATVSTDTGALRVASIYLPNGNPVDSEKFPYKLAWMDRLYRHARDLLEQEEPLVLAGDYNVIPEPRDCYSPQAWEGDALFRDESRQAFRRLLGLGLTEALRATNDADETYTFWDFQGGAWKRNNGIRIDHFLLSPESADRLSACEIDKETRGWVKPSDHVPIWVDLAIA